MEPRWYGLVERTKKYHGNFELSEEQAEKMKPYYTKLHRLHQSIIVDLQKLRGISSKQVLEMVFSRVHNFVIWCCNDFRVFGKDTRFHKDVFNTCFFTALCMFIQDTKRPKGSSLRDFVYKHSSYKFNIKNTEHYFDLDYPPKTFHGFSLFDSEVKRLRKMRHRLLSKRPVYIKRSEWSAMSKSSEHEWALYYVLNILNNDLLDTYKRIGNLNNEINASIREFKTAPKDEDYNKLEDAYKKFSSKLKK